MSIDFEKSMERCKIMSQKLDEMTIQVDKLMEDSDKREALNKKYRKLNKIFEEEYKTFFNAKYRYIPSLNDAFDNTWFDSDSDDDDFENAKFYHDFKRKYEKEFKEIYYWKK